MKTIPILLASALLFCGDFSAAELPAPETLVLENDALRVEIVPAWGGRMMYFGRKGGSNALWTDPAAATNTVNAAGKPIWKNVGGEKTWVGGISSWKGFKTPPVTSSWPPPEWFDSAPLDVVRANATNILLRSGAHSNEDWTVAVEREFTLDGDKLVLHEALDNRSKATRPLSTNDIRRVWSVTQIPLVPRVIGRLCGEGRMVLERKGKPCFPVPEPLDGGWIGLDLAAAWKDAKIDFDGDMLAAPLADGSGNWLVIGQTAPERHLGSFVTPARAMVYTTGPDPAPSKWNGHSPRAYIELEFVALGPDAEQTLVFRIEDAPPVSLNAH